VTGLSPTGGGTGRTGCQPRGAPYNPIQAPAALTSRVGPSTLTSVRGAAEQETPVPRRPLIGLATQTLQPIPGQVPLAWVMGQKYVRVLTSLGAVPWLVPLLHDDEATLREVYDRLDGVFVTGGVDVDPPRYGEERLPVCGPSDADRDATE